MTDRLWRALLFVLYRGLRVWWFVRRPAVAGAFVAVWVGDRLLLVRNSYRHGETLPCGTIARRESPRQAARRELEEEVGLRVGEDELTFAAELVVRHEFKEDHAFVYELALDAAPEIRVDRREVVSAELVREADLEARPLVPQVRAYLDWRRGGSAAPRGGESPPG